VTKSEQATELVERIARDMPPWVFERCLELATDDARTEIAKDSNRTDPSSPVEI
jgi:hypothetical protein